MSKWLIHGDPHLKANNLILAREFFSWIKSVADEHDVEGIINLGDTFDTHAVLRSEILSEYVNFLDTRGDRIYIHILGNHEMYKPNDARYHALKPFMARNDAKYHVVDEPKLLYGMGFVPYCPKAEDFPNLGSDAQLLFAHQTFLGASFGHFKPEDGVDPDALPHVSIYSGHIHNRQVFGKVNYVGSPISYGINDADQIKGLLILDDETLNEDFIASPFPAWRSLKLDVMMENCTETLVKSINTKDNWVVDVVGPRIELAAFMDSKLISALRKKAKIRFRAKVTDAGKEKATIKAINLRDMFEEYIERVYTGSIDREVLKRSMKELIGE